MAAHRMFNYVLTLKRFGADVEQEHAPGSLITLCPSCPQPCINMDPNWRDAPESESYLHALFYGTDGNFHLCHNAKKMDLLDTALGDGAGSCVNSARYRHYLSKMAVYDDLQEETSGCSNFTALSDRYKGKIATGQVSLSCIRHGLLLPCGTVDLHAGEHYMNVDYATLCGLERFLDLNLHISSYDVNCKYGIHFWSRLRQIAAALPSVPGVMRDRSDWPVIRRMLPKGHANAHKGICKYFYSPYYLLGIGNTDGESVERNWSLMNATGRSVREMTPGHRQDVIEAHNADTNIRKLFRTSEHPVVFRLRVLTPRPGHYLKVKLERAIKLYDKHKAELEDMESTLQMNARPLDKWRDDVAMYLSRVKDGEITMDIYNPYIPVKDEGKHSIRANFAVLTLRSTDYARRTR